MVATCKTALPGAGGVCMWGGVSREGLCANRGDTGVSGRRGGLSVHVRGTGVPKEVGMRGLDMKAHGRGGHVH